MEERQILSKKDANGSPIGNFQENQIVYEPAQYYKSFTKTKIEPITIEYTWEIESFIGRYKYINTLTSVPFPETGQYMIEIIVSPADMKKRVEFYLLGKKKSQGSVYISIKATNIKDSDPHLAILTHTIGSLNMSDRICLIRIMDSEFCDYSRIEPLIIYCKIQIPYQTLHNSMYLPVLPAACSKTLESQNLIFDNNSTSDNRTITFKINKDKYYTVPKKLLRAINSSYFEHLYSTYKEDEKDMTEELIEIKEQTAFEQMLSFIITGSVPAANIYKNYQDLLKVADRCDVQNLKLMCEQYLLTKINIGNAIDFIKLAFSCNAKHLETGVSNFIKFYFKEIVRTEEFRCLSQEYSDRLIQLLAENKISGTFAVASSTSSS